MKSKEALDNLHRCALCHKAEKESEWVEHCREKREIVEKDLDKLEELENAEKELGIDLITLSKALTGIYYRFNSNDYIRQMKFPMLRIIKGEYCWICPKWMTTTWMNVKVKDYGKTWALTKEELKR